MPYLHSYDDPADDPERVVAGKPFIYEPTYCENEPWFDPAAFAEKAGPVLDWLREMGATAVRVRYDGGSDEGFAWFGSAVTPAGVVPKDELLTRWLAEGRAAALPPRTRRDWETREDMPLTDAELLEDALEDVAGSLDWRFLGEGWGNGPGELFGEVEYDLRTGEFTDLPAADPHPEGICQYPDDPPEEDEPGESRTVDQPPVSPDLPYLNARTPPEFVPPTYTDTGPVDRPPVRCPKPRPGPLARLWRTLTGRA